MPLTFTQRYIFPHYFNFLFYKALQFLHVLSTANCINLAVAIYIMCIFFLEILLFLFYNIFGNFDNYKHCDVSSAVVIYTKCMF